MDTVYIGTSRGAIQCVDCTLNKDVHISSQVQSEITALNWNADRTGLLVGHKSGVLKQFDPLNHKFTECVKKLHGDGAIIGLGTTHERQTVVAYEDGTVNIFHPDSAEVDCFSLNLEQKATLRVCITNEHILATGGDHCPFKLWDTKVEKCIFQSKSLPHDELNLPIKVSISGICFLDDDNYESVVVSKEGRILVYDSRVQRRPVINIVEKKASYTCITRIHDGNQQIITGTARGYVQIFDMKKPAKCLNTISSYVGSITDMKCANDDEPLVITTSLDRFLRVHNYKTKQLTYHKYMKHCLTKIQI